MAITFFDSDFVPSSSYPWYKIWAGRVSDQQLLHIQPVTELKAEEIHTHAVQMSDGENYPDFKFSIYPNQIYKNLMKNSNEEIKSIIHEMLNTHIDSTCSKVIVSWDKVTAFLIPDRLFLDNWQLFVSSIDTILWCEHEEWALTCNHEHVYVLGFKSVM